MRLSWLLTLVCAVTLPTAPPAAAATTPDHGIEVLAVRSVSDREISLVVMAPRSKRPVAVTALAGGTELPTRVDPVLSDRSAVALVLDASAAGAPALRGGGLSGAASFLLQLPSGTSTALIADRRPPEVAASASVGVSDDLRAASSLRSSGGRATSDALTLAVQQLPARPAARPVIVLYTTAPTAGGEPATVLAERLRTAGTILAVVTTSGDDAYWPTVATLTGGMAIATPPGRSLEAFDAVADALGRRFTVTFSRPPAGVTRVGLRVEADGGPVLVDVDLPIAQVPSSGTGPPAAEKAGSGYLWAWLVAALFLAAVFGAALRNRRRAGRADLTPVPPGPPREPSLFDEAGAAGPTGPDHERDLAAEYQRLAGHDRAEGRLALAASGYRQAVDSLGQRVELEPGNPAFQYDLAIAVTELAELDADQGWIAQAAAGYQRAIELGERLVLAHPGNPDYRRTLDLARARAAALEQGASARSAFPDADADRRRRWTFRITRR